MSLRATILRRPVTLGRMKRALESYGLAKSVYDVARDIVGVLGFLFPWAFGLSDRAAGIALDIAQMSFPARLFASLAAAAVLGIGLGFAANRLTLRDTHLTMWIAGLLAGAWAFLLIVAVHAFSRAAGNVPLEFSLLLLLCLCLSVLLLTNQMSFRMTAISGDRVADRGTIVLIYVGTAVSTAVLLLAMGS